MMLRITGIIALLAVLASFTFLPEKKDEEKYKVIKVNGVIVYKKTGKNMSTGDEFIPATPLDFKTTDAKAAVISPSKGRFVLTANNSGRKSNLVPAMNNVSSRSGAIINLIDLQNHFSGKYLIIDQVKLRIGKELFPMDSTHFFFARYEYNGETINKVLRSSNDSLIIDRDEIFTIDKKRAENPEAVQLSLFYRNTETKENLKISSFEALFPDEKVLEEEVKVIIETIPEADRAKKRDDEVVAYLNEFYGKPDKDNVSRWLNEHFK